MFYGEKKSSRLLALIMVLIVGIALAVATEDVSAATKKPSKVTGVKVTSTYNSCKVTWKAAKNAKKYKVYRAVKNNKTGKYGKYKAVKTTTAKSYTNKNLTCGNTYKYKVRAVNGKKYGSYSSAVSKTCYPQTTTLSTPDSDTGGITLAWKNINGESGYQIYRAASKTGTYSRIKTTTSTSHIDTTASEGATYYYKVRSYKSIGYGKYVYSGYSNIVSGTRYKAEDIAYLEYNKDGDTAKATRIYIGQSWTDELNAALNGGSAVEKTLSRNSIYSTGGTEDIYCYDTEDFDNFLIVYVKGGKIIAWQTNAEVLGVYKGTKLVRGTQSSSYADYDVWGSSTGMAPYVPASKVVASNIKIGDIYFGGIVQDTGVWDDRCNIDNMEAEELLCEYTVNALRVINGKNILVHNDYLYGDGETYGAKAWSMTQSASGTMTHGELSEGPLAGKTASERATDVKKMSNNTVFKGSENVAEGGSGGERVANAWYRSVGHSQSLMTTGCFETVTEDASMQAAAVYPSTDGYRVYWTWCIGYKIIDWGVRAPEVTISNVTESSADISWTDTLSQFEGTGHSYLIEVSKGSTFETGDIIERVERNSPKTSYSVSSLEESTIYYVRIKATRNIVDGDTSFMKSSDWSDTYEFTTLATETE